MSTIYDDIDEIDENQAKQIFDFLSKKAESIGGKRLDIVEYYGSFASVVIYSVAAMRDDGMSIDGYVGTFNKKDGWGEFVDLVLFGKEHLKYKMAVAKILEICQHDDIRMQSRKCENVVIVDKGTTLHQLLIEIDLVGCYDNK